jgi:hypothetical protein
MSPREGHMEAVKRILAYLKTFQKGDLLLIQHIQITPYTLLKITLIGKFSIQMLKKIFQITFLRQRDQKSG